MKVIKIIAVLMVTFSAYANALTCDKITQTINTLSDTLNKLDEKGRSDSFEYREIAEKLRHYMREQKKACSRE